MQSLPPSGTECWDDDDCAGVPNKPQCGYALFDFVAKVDPPAGPTDPRVVTLEHEVTTTGKDRRGVCDTALPRTQVCAKGNPCAGGEPCIGYGLEAREKLQ